MLPCQRALFDIPREVCFLNAASWSPLPLAVQEAGRAAVARKGQPWKLPADFQPQQYERARKAAAALRRWANTSSPPAISISSEIQPMPAIMGSFHSSK